MSEQIRTIGYSVEHITAVISKLEALAEMLPGVVHAANHCNPPSRAHAGTPTRTTYNVETAIEMLKEYRRQTEKVRDDERINSVQASLREAWQAGHGAGIADGHERANAAKSSKAAKAKTNKAKAKAKSSK